MAWLTKKNIALVLSVLLNILGSTGVIPPLDGGSDCPGALP